jgi:hypothetical protein
MHGSQKVELKKSTFTLRATASSVREFRYES